MASACRDPGPSVRQGRQDLGAAPGVRERGLRSRPRDAVRRAGDAEAHRAYVRRGRARGPPRRPRRTRLRRRSYRWPPPSVAATQLTPPSSLRAPRPGTRGSRRVASRRFGRECRHRRHRSARRSVPARIANSTSFGISQSVTARRPASIGAAGRRVQDRDGPALARPRTRRASRPAGSRTGRRRRRDAAVAGSPPPACSGVTRSLAPGTTMIRFVPSASTQIGATPLEPGDPHDAARPRSRAARSCRGSCQRRRRRPSAPMNATSAPRRRAMTAWLAPLPPKPDWKRSPMTVSPGPGARRA